MKFAESTFSSKVARRAFLLFVVCALGPISILAFLSIRQVTTELREQSERRLRQASKAVGLELHRRLIALDASLDLPVPAASETAAETLRRPFLSVQLFRTDGSVVPISGEPAALPPLSLEQLRSVRTGGTVLTMAEVDGGTPPSFFLSRLRDRASPDSGILRGEIDRNYIWMIEDEANLERGTQLLVLGERGQVLFSSARAGPVAPKVAARASSGAGGEFTWTDGREWMAASWSLFLNKSFHAPRWTVVLSRPTSEVMAPMAAFTHTFVVISLLSVLAVLWLSITQIRRILQPVARLQEATTRLAEGRLDSRVDVRSGDEFEALADSFNQMATQLGRQFDALAMRHELTLALSRSDPTREVLQSCTEILVRHLRLSTAGVWLTGKDETILELTAVSGETVPPKGHLVHLTPGQGEIGRVAAERRPATTNALPSSPSWAETRWPGTEKVIAFVGHPLVSNGRLHGVAAAFASRELDGIDLATLASAAGEIGQGVARRLDAEALRGSEEQVRQLQKTEAVGRLAGGIAHDFNNLLTVITGYSELLVMDLPEGGDRKRAEIIKQTGERAAHLTRQLLAFSRKQVLAPALVDLNTVVKAMTAILHRLVGATVEIVFHPSVAPALVKVDRSQFEQVIVNLVVNARDAMPDGGRIIVETAVSAPRSVESGAVGDSSAEPRQVVVTVRDTGIGMDAATQARIFEPFFTTKEPGKGTGLGLATVYGIVAQSGGRIQVESAPGKGTTFTLAFPLVAGRVQDLAADTAVAPRGTETILLVEDEQAVRLLLEQVIGQQGYRVLSAGRPSDALRLAEQHAGPIHLLLTDLVMPEMSGTVLAGRLCALRPELTVLQMSGYSDTRAEDQGERGTRPAFLQKPFTPAAVAHAIRAALDAARRN